MRAVDPFGPTFQVHTLAPPKKRHLHWGPFSVGATVTLIVAALLWLACRALGSHWYTWAVGVPGALLTLLLGASAVGALRRRSR